MILTDYYRSTPDSTWEIGRQLGVKHGVIRLPEDSNFDPSCRSHWLPVHKRFVDYGIKPIIIEPMPNSLHDHIKAGDSMRDKCIEKVLKMFPIMDELDVRTICFNWMAYVGWTRTRNNILERGGARPAVVNPVRCTKQLSFLYIIGEISIGNPCFVRRIRGQIAVSF